MAIAMGICLFYPVMASASNKVSSPDVTKGQMEFEYRGGYDTDGGPAKNRQEVDKFVANYGLTDRWRMEAKAIASGTHSDVDWTSIEYSNRYQVFKDKDAWLRLSVQANYKFSLVEEKPDKIEFSTLAAKDIGLFSHIANVNFENEVGAHARGGTDVNIGWKSKYRFNPLFEPGGEIYADFGKLSGNNIQKYQAGPAIGGKISESIKYETGYLFGLNKNIPDGRFKIILTYAFK